MLENSVKLVLAVSIAVVSSTGARADEGSVPYSYSESYESRGVGFRGANRIEFKYKERLKNWGEQIQMGINKGWLSEADAGIFKERLEKLRALETEVSSKGYPKPELDDMEKQFTRYNQDLSDAGSKATIAPPVPKGADKSPADVVAPESAQSSEEPNSAATSPGASPQAQSTAGSGRPSAKITSPANGSGKKQAPKNPLSTMAASKKAAVKKK